MMKKEEQQRQNWFHILKKKKKQRNIFSVLIYRDILYFFWNLIHSRWPGVVVPVTVLSMYLIDFYHSGFLDCCLHLYCYIYISDDMSSKLRSLHSTLNHVLLSNSQGSCALIPFIITWYNLKYSCTVTCLQSGLNLQPQHDCHLGNQRL